MRNKSKCLAYCFPHFRVKLLKKKKKVDIGTYALETKKQNITARTFHFFV